MEWQDGDAPSDLLEENANDARSIHDRGRPGDPRRPGERTRSTGCAARVRVSEAGSEQGAAGRRYRCLPAVGDPAGAAVAGADRTGHARARRRGRCGPRGGRGGGRRGGAGRRGARRGGGRGGGGGGGGRGGGGRGGRGGGGGGGRGGGGGGGASLEGRRGGRSGEVYKENIGI